MISGDSGAKVKTGCVSKKAVLLTFCQNEEDGYAIFNDNGLNGFRGLSCTLIVSMAQIREIRLIRCLVIF